MNSLLTQFAATSAEDQGILGSLGIDWQVLILQSIAFLLLFALLAKFVYPTLTKVLDKRDADLKAAADAARIAEEHAQKTEQRTADLLDEARKEAGEIVASAQKEASATIEEAQEKAASKAEAMINSAKNDIAKEVESAKKTLHNETLDLVARATGVVAKKELNSKDESRIIQQAIKESR